MYTKREWVNACVQHAEECKKLVQKEGLPSLETLVELAQETGGKAYADKIILILQPMVTHICSGFSSAARYGVEPLDMVNECTLRVYSAINNYTRGHDSEASFKTYVYPYVYFKAFEVMSEAKSYWERREGVSDSI